MRSFTRRAVTLAFTVGALASCAPVAPAPSVSETAPSAPSSTATAEPTTGTADPSRGVDPSSTATPKENLGPLTEPGNAARVIQLLLAHAGDHPAVKVDITRDQAALTLLLPTREVRTYQWRQGEITQVDSDVQDIDQQTFDPLAFNLSDVGALFRTAVRLGGSSSEQELQIVEYNSAQVLMTVTTRPESATVFFRRDGTPINQLTFDSVSDLAEAMRDTMNGRYEVFAVGMTPGQGFWCDYAGTEDGTIVRATRQAKLPVYMSTRREAAPVAFATDDVTAAAIAEVLDRLHSEYDVHAREVTLAIDMKDQRSTPTMRFTFMGRTVITDLNGYDITALVQ